MQKETHFLQFFWWFIVQGYQLCLTEFLHYKFKTDISKWFSFSLLNLNNLILNIFEESECIWTLKYPVLNTERTKNSNKISIFLINLLRLSLRQKMSKTTWWDSLVENWHCTKTTTVLGWPRGSASLKHLQDFFKAISQSALSHGPKRKLPCVLPRLCTGWQQEVPPRALRRGMNLGRSQPRQQLLTQGKEIINSSGVKDKYQRRTETKTHEGRRYSM